MTNDFKSKLVVVTGGAQNIGFGIAKAFAERGATVVAADLKPSDNLAEAGINFIKTDVTQEDSVAELMQNIDKQYGRLDVLVNNAGICVETPLQDMTLADFERTMSINVTGVFLTTKHAFNLMSNGTSKDPAIVNISSIEGFGANPLHAAYGASKGAVASFTNNTALEYGPHGIRCNAIAPGWINTPFNEAFLDAFPDREKVDSEIKALHPVGRLGLPKDIAETAVWLASPQAAFVTGQEIVVDGGRTSKLPLPQL